VVDRQFNAKLPRVSAGAIRERDAIVVTADCALEHSRAPEVPAMSMFRISSLSVVVGALVAACGGAQPEAEAPPAAPSAAPAPVEAPPAPSATEAPPAPSAAAPAPEPAAPKKTAWKDMTEDQKKEVMKTVVFPAMKTAFQEFDAKHFKDFTCVTCHGAGAKEGKFKMPNPKLPKLDPKDEFAKHKKKDAKILGFMMEKVAPEMAKLLEVEPYDPKTNQGFGCMNCHTMAGK
jgi:hypothetical protein